MDKWVTVKKSSANHIGVQDAEKMLSKHRYSPYAGRNTTEKKLEARKEKKALQETFLAPVLKDGKKPSSSTLTKHLLKNLNHEANPITHSDIAARSDHVTSAATGHQRSEGRGNRTVYLEHRKTKLAEQLPQSEVKSKSTKLLANVKVYIDGFLNNTTDIEMKRIVTLSGGTVMQTASGATHVLTSQQLSGSKAHKQLTAKARNKIHVVKPEWITDNIDAGKRLPEWKYSVVQDTSMRRISDIFGSERA